MPVAGYYAPLAGRLHPCQNGPFCQTLPSYSIMLLTVTTTHRPATDLGYLLHKNPARRQSFALSFGSAHVFYPEATEDCCTAALLLDVDPVAMVRGKSGLTQTVLAQYVNDRPYVASSFMSVAIAQVLGPALDGRSKERPELAQTPIPLVATIEVLPCRGGEDFLHEVFDPLGYRDNPFEREAYEQDGG